MKIVTLTPNSNKVGHIVQVDKKHPKYGGKLARVKRFLPNGKVAVGIISSRGGLPYLNAMIKIQYLQELVYDEQKKDSVGEESSSSGKR